MADGNPLSEEKPIKYEGIIKSYYKKHPLVIEAMLKRHIVYNRMLEELEGCFYL